MTSQASTTREDKLQFDPDRAREVRAVLDQLERAELSSELRADLRRVHVLTHN